VRVLDSPQVNVPNVLTISRLIFSPLFLPFLIVYLLPFNIFWINCFIAVVFGFFGLTDFFDGYLARKLKQETQLGKVLDPIADKFLLYSSLVALLAAGKIYFYWVVLLIGREIFMMGLRNIALEHKFSVNVSMLGKIKTTLQMLYIIVVILNPAQNLGMQGSPQWNGTEAVLLFFTLFASLFSAYKYYVSFVLLLKKEEPVPAYDVEEEDDEFTF
jgi:CDP-diacylglycerol--glycerol-3-phosphate 3-phosphatidyltransferase